MLCDKAVKVVTESNKNRGINIESYCMDFDASNRGVISSTQVCFWWTINKTIVSDICLLGPDRLNPAQDPTKITGKIATEKI